VGGEDKPWPTSRSRAIPHTVGELPKVGSPGRQLPDPNFGVTRGDLSDISLADFEGKVEILNIAPSLDTGLGAASARRFEKEAGDLGRRTTPPSWRGSTEPSTGRGSSTRDREERIVDCATRGLGKNHCKRLWPVAVSGLPCWNRVT
jgi:hypothetical protein